MTNERQPQIERIPPEDEIAALRHEVLVWKRAHARVTLELIAAKAAN